MRRDGDKSALRAIMHEIVFEQFARDGRTGSRKVANETKRRAPELVEKLGGVLVGDQLVKLAREVLKVTTDDEAEDAPQIAGFAEIAPIVRRKLPRSIAVPRLPVDQAQEDEEAREGEEAADDEEERRGRPSIDFIALGRETDDELDRGIDYLGRQIANDQERYAALLQYRAWRRSRTA